MCVRRRRACAERSAAFSRSNEIANFIAREYISTPPPLAEREGKSVLPFFPVVPFPARRPGAGKSDQAYLL